MSASNLYTLLRPVPDTSGSGRSLSRRVYWPVEAHNSQCAQAVEAVRKNVEGRRAFAKAAAGPPAGGSSGQGLGGSNTAAWTSPNGSAGISPMKFAALKQAAQEFQRQVTAARDGVGLWSPCHGRPLDFALSHSPAQAQNPF